MSVEHNMTGTQPHSPEPEPGRQPMPRSSPRLRGIREQYERAMLFLAEAQKMPKGSRRFRHLMASVYFARAAVEIMFEMAEKGELRIGREPLRPEISKRLARYDLIYRVRIHDFHRFGVLPNNSLFIGGPMTLTAKGGYATAQFPPGGMQQTCTGESYIDNKEQKKVLQVSGEYLFDEERREWVWLGKALTEHLRAMPTAISYLESVLR